MNILFFTHSYTFGGNDTFLLDLCRAWPNKHDRLITSTNHRLGIEAYRKAADQTRLVFETFHASKILNIFAFNADRGVLHKFASRVWTMFRLLYLSVVSFFEFRRIVRKHHIEMYVSNSGGYPAGWLNVLTIFYARMLGVKKTYLIVHNFPAHSRCSFWGSVSKFANQCCNNVVTVSNVVAEALRKNTYFNKVVVIHNGIAKETVPRRKIKLKYSKNLAVIGHLEQRKGHAYLLEALPQIVNKYPDVGVYFIGTEGPAYDGLVMRMQHLNVEDHVFCMGYQHDVEALIPNFDFLVFPSVEYESFGLVILEGWKYYKPTIAFKSGGIPEVITHREDGILVDNRDIKGLASSCITLLKDEELCMALGMNGHAKHNQRFNAEHMSTQYYELFMSSNEQVLRYDG
ncbi:MAG TPA: glycosyltransferase family 1 protein [Alphaproteobacteria bacterium]|nr:glycosyltransferase family 1 protein [Alphaproteobacteria bacterium]